MQRTDEVGWNFVWILKNTTRYTPAHVFPAPSHSRLVLWAGERGGRRGIRLLPSVAVAVASVSVSVNAGGEAGGRQDRRWSGVDGCDGGLGLSRWRRGGDDGVGEKMGVDSAGEQGLLVIAFKSELFVGKG